MDEHTEKQIYDIIGKLREIRNPSLGKDKVGNYGAKKAAAVAEGALQLLLHFDDVDKEVSR